MAKRTRSINAELKEYIRLLRDSYNVYAVTLFGSHAAGKAGDYSDIDVAVFSDDFGEGPFLEMKGLLKLRRKVTPDIEPLPFSKHVFFEHDKAEFVSEILSKGKVIYKEEQTYI
ncbi:MAG: nucleotidyltransferase domain-containing protein [Deltaproteobacteria bacterium]|nr:nucleotidyltransferase domain-containing protein [Deltaproteobacteria bacterium]